MNHVRNNIINLSISVLLLWFGLAISASATTLVSMSIDQISSEAELIFEGEVLVRETRRDTSNDLIYTYVTFAVRDVVKGSYGGSELELRFTGGSIDNEIVEINGLTLPGEGEQGIYFVESISRNLLNPMLGWSQGHYLIHEENGERHVSTLEEEHVISVQPVSNVPRALRRAQRLIEGQTDTADGIVSVPAGLNTSEALTVDEFKEAIRSLLP